MYQGANASGMYLVTWYPVHDDHSFKKKLYASEYWAVKRGLTLIESGRALNVKLYELSGTDVSGQNLAGAKNVDLDRKSVV